MQSLNLHRHLDCRLSRNNHFRQTRPPGPLFQPSSNQPSWTLVTTDSAAEDALTSSGSIPAPDLPAGRLDSPIPHPLSSIRYRLLPIAYWLLAISYRLSHIDLRLSHIDQRLSAIARRLSDNDCHPLPVPAPPSAAARHRWRVTRRGSRFVGLLSPTGY